MKKADLIALGLAEDVVEKVIVLHGKDIEAHKAKVTNAESERDQFKTQLTEANQQIESFKGMDIETIKKTADDYKTKFEQAQLDAQKQLDAMKFDHALESALTGAKVKNPKTVQPLLSRDALKLKEDGTIEGLEDQLTKIKSENDYLFADAKEPPRIVTGGNNKPITGDPVVIATRKAAGLPID